MAILQARRISYTRRDLLSYHSDMSRYIKEFVTRVTDASEANTGRLYLTLVEALVDNANFSLDQVHLELQINKAQQRKNIVRAAYMLGYPPSPVSASTVDATWSMLSGVAPGGGQAIPIYTRAQTIVTPTLEWITLEAATIPEGESSVSVPMVQGVRVTSEVLTASASGNPDQEYTLLNARTPHIYVEVRVDGVLWTQVDDWMDSDEESQHYKLEFDENDYTTVIFGDGEFGLIPDSGSQITASYIRTDAEDGNSEPGAIARVVGTLASTVGVTNALKASGGAESETNDSIVRNAPANNAAQERAVAKRDYEAIATAVAGVYKAFAIRSEGSRTDIYILPEGGGVASSTLISQTQDAVDDAAMEGAVPVVDTIKQAGIVVSVNVVTFTNDIQKSTVKAKVVEATEENLEYTELTRGRAFTISDLSGIYEAIDEGSLIDYVDFSIMTRVPRVVQSNVSAPAFVGRVNVYDGVGYNDVLVTAVSTTQFSVSVDSIPQSALGTVATAFTTDDGFISFTLGESGDTLTVGDTWRFKTSEYNNNIVIDGDEVMELQQSSDLVVSVFYPDEYNIKTRSAA